MLKTIFYTLTVYLLSVLNGYAAFAQSNIDESRESLNAAHNQAYKKLKAARGKKDQDKKKVLQTSLDSAKSEHRKRVIDSVENIKAKDVASEQHISDEGGASSDSGSPTSDREAVALDGSHVKSEISFKNSDGSQESDDASNSASDSTSGSTADEISFGNSSN